MLCIPLIVEMKEVRKTHHKIGGDRNLKNFKTFHVEENIRK